MKSNLWGNYFKARNGEEKQKTLELEGIVRVNIVCET